MNTTELRALLGAATPRPWILHEWSSPRGARHYRSIGTEDASDQVLQALAVGFSRADADLILAAVHALPALLDVVEAAEIARTGIDGKTANGGNYFVETVKMDLLRDALTALREALAAGGKA